MKKFLFTALLALLAAGVGAQEQQKEEGYRFTDVKTLPVTSVKNQNRSGTCWAYSALAFLESEILRNGGGEYDLSAMWIVRNAYFEKAVKYARMHGSLNLAVGGGSRDVTDGSGSTASCRRRSIRVSATAPTCPTSRRSTASSRGIWTP